MSIRHRKRCVAYLRRSDNKQESSLDTQLTWALKKANQLGLALKVQRSDLDGMRSESRYHHGSIYLDDDLSGSELKRPGFVALIDDVMRDTTISDVLVYKRDRLSRSEDVPEMMGIERRLVKAGVAMHFSDDEALPTESGERDLTHDVKMLLSYHQGHDFIRNLADRIVENKRYLGE